jgi:hypothetical protein
MASWMNRQSWAMGHGPWALQTAKKRDMGYMGGGWGGSWYWYLLGAALVLRTASSCLGLGNLELGATKRAVVVLVLALIWSWRLGVTRPAYPTGVVAIAITQSQLPYATATGVSRPVWCPVSGSA